GQVGAGGKGLAGGIGEDVVLIGAYGGGKGDTGGGGGGYDVGVEAGPGGDVKAGQKGDAPRGGYDRTAIAVAAQGGVLAEYGGY
ncbi:RNA-binding protein, partial [Pararcticibacter amylolyticus]